MYTQGYTTQPQKEQNAIAAAWMDPEITILSEVSQEDKYHGITYTWNQNMTQVNLSKKQKQTHRENTPAAAKGERGAGVWGQQRKTVTY